MKFIRFLSRIALWPRTLGELSALERALIGPRRSIITDANEAFHEARVLTHEKPSILRSRRERLLVRLIIREVRRASASRYLTSWEQRIFPVYHIADVFESYLNRGFLYFSDCGISPESQFQFLECGKTTRELYRELKAVSNRERLDHMLYEGDDRKEEYQRRVYDGPMSSVFDRHLSRTA